jgi:hypothetical protein
VSRLRIQNRGPVQPEAVCEVVIPKPEGGDGPPNGI